MQNSFFFYIRPNEIFLLRNATDNFGAYCESILFSIFTTLIIPWRAELHKKPIDCQINPPVKRRSTKISLSLSPSLSLSRALVLSFVRVYPRRFLSIFARSNSARRSYIGQLAEDRLINNADAGERMKRDTR